MDAHVHAAPRKGALLEPAMVARPEHEAPPGTTDYKRTRLLWLWNGLLAIDLVVLGIGLVQGIVGGVLAQADPASEFARSVRRIPSESEFVLNGLFTLLFMGFLPLVWVARTRAGKWPALGPYFGLHRLGRSLFVGVGLAGIELGAVLLLVFFLPHEMAGEEPLRMSWAAAVFVALAAGIAEELFFRGLLQRWIGWWGQGILFGLFHFSGGYLVQVLVAMTAGLLFGWLRHRGWSLWVLITAHVVYDMFLLALALLTG